MEGVPSWSTTHQRSWVSSLIIRTASSSWEGDTARHGRTLHVLDQGTAGHRFPLNVAPLEPPSTLPPMTAVLRPLIVDETASSGGQHPLPDRREQCPDEAAIVLIVPVLTSPWPSP